MITWGMAWHFYMLCNPTSDVAHRSEWAKLEHHAAVLLRDLPHPLGLTDRPHRATQVRRLADQHRFFAEDER